MNGEMQSGEVQVTAGMMDSMRSIKPWTKFLAVLGFVFVGLMVLLGAGFMLFASMFPHQKNMFPSFMGFLYILFSILYFVPAFYLYKYSSAIADFLRSNGAGDLESALSYQKSFWKFVGILTLIGILLAILAIAAAIIIPIMVRMKMQQVA